LVAEPSLTVGLVPRCKSAGFRAFKPLKMISKSLATLMLSSLLIGGGFRAGASQSRDLNKQDPPIPTIDFCDMVAHPARYFDKTIRINATFELGDEGSNLNNVRCVRSHDDSIGAGSARISDRQVELLNQSYRAITSGKFGNQPAVTVVGILRNQSVRAFAWYRYSFDIINFEYIRNEISETIVNFDGSLRANQTYRGMVRGDQQFGLNFAFFPLRAPMHQSVRLEWINLPNFRILQRLRPSDQKQIVFRVTNDDIKQMEPRRWGRTIQLEILLVEWRIPFDANSSATPMRG
jgi:hypothetical protein